MLNIKKIYINFIDTFLLRGLKIDKYNMNVFTNINTQSIIYQGKKMFKITSYTYILILTVPKFND